MSFFLSHEQKQKIKLIRDSNSAFLSGNVPQAIDLFIQSEKLGFAANSKERLELLKKTNITQNLHQFFLSNIIENRPTLEEHDKIVEWCHFFDYQNRLSDSYELLGSEIHQSLYYINLLQSLNDSEYINSIDIFLKYLSDFGLFRNPISWQLCVFSSNSSDKEVSKIDFSLDYDAQIWCVIWESLNNRKLYTKAHAFLDNVNGRLDKEDITSDYKKSIQNLLFENNATTFELEEDYFQVLKILDYLVISDPNNPRYWHKKLIIHELLRQYGEAINACKFLLQLDPTPDLKSKYNSLLLVQKTSNQSLDDPLLVLKIQLAKGEITEDDYFRKKILIL